MVIECHAPACSMAHQAALLRRLGTTEMWTARTAWTQAPFKRLPRSPTEFQRALRTNMLPGCRPHRGHET